MELKNSLLLMATLACAGLCANAEVKVCYFEELGEIDGISDNGHYGAITDPDFGTAYLWSESDPENLKDISAVIGEGGNFSSSETPMATTAMDVSNDGIVVGSIKIGAVFYPAYYKEGAWTRLSLDANAMNTNEAICITPDGKVIAGYQFINDPTSEIGGRYYPCQWFLNDEGTYDLKAYTNIELPDHQGFFPMAQTPDGEVIAGKVYCGMQSTINAIIKDGEFIIFDEIKTEYEPWFFRGKYYAGNDENGKQIWVEDVNDPRVVLFPEVYINGYKDGEAPLEGFFSNCDGDGNLYGARSRVENVNEDGEGDVFTEACIYNYKTDTWYVDGDYAFFSAGVGNELLFTGTGEMIDGDEVTTVQDAYGIETTTTVIGDYEIQSEVAGVNKISIDGRVLGAVIAEPNPANQEMMYYPLFIVTEEESGIQSVAGNPKKGLVIVGAGRIEVVNADAVAVYDLDGRLIGTDKITYVDPGIYVVKAGDAVYKVDVK